MSTAILLSIKPEFASAIFSGEKLYEFRKAVFRNRSINKVYVYASAPVSRVIGHFFISEIIEGHPRNLWEETSYGAGISKKYFNEYFANRNLGYALRVMNAQLFKESQDLKEMFGIRHPPQSFRYVPSFSADL